ncbi:site-specific integrase [Bizionia gelidisalsuginis]|uniref:Site-specific integrase n=1 Tax=Bizionia gelidisalsuginis TaxID=291188 RepID=A0ABY3MBX7_9FLAO|nr:tyrosine-type recombinase/integrase [Bizionia gelidisalsuginis]TYC14794.1 site-specific integrase [Bizionia gelidisalsuginis]
MRYTFNLRKPKSLDKTLIVFSSYFKNEGKKFVYSTGESIAPSEWDFENRLPKNLNGRTAQANDNRSIKNQLDRYSMFFAELTNRYINSNLELDIETTKKEFDKHFKKVEAISNRFFDVYDLFLKAKKSDFTDNANSSSTIKRYEYNKTLLNDYQTYQKKSLHLSKINFEFYNDYVNYSVTEKKHSANTLRRNIGLLKTFLNWAVENNHTYNVEFRTFQSPKAFDTDEIALNLEQVQEVYRKDFSKHLKLERVRDLFVFGCSTGMRYSNYSKVNRNDVQNDMIRVMDQKNKDKVLSIPLNSISKAVLVKYDYNLPVISEQKFNEYIKDVFKACGYDEEIKKISKIGNQINEEMIPFYKRISSHTARRSFITIMKNKKIPDKVIMSFTGHKSLEVFNKYYKPHDVEKVDFMKNVWN